MSAEQYPQPNALALARHNQPCRADLPLTFEQLHALAGKWDRYPAPTVTAPACPNCGAALPPHAVYCGAACSHAAQKRLIDGKAKRREPEELAGYSFPPPHGKGGTA